ncbi:MAG: hypothetical protein ACREL5_00015 [Gemmatimonadales bacterium]
MRIPLSPRRFLLAGSLALASAACNSSTPTLGPGDAIRGQWVDTDVSLAATASGMSFVQTCSNAEFAPATLDENGDFTVVSTRYTILGNIRHFGDERLELIGHVDATQQLSLTVRVLSDSLPVSDPWAVTLHPGKVGSPPLCSA